MTQDRINSLFFEIFSSDLPRQGPGDRGSTLRALALVPNVGPTSRILDVGCGTGPQTLVLADQCEASIVAVDTTAFWEREHPAIADVPAMLASIRHCGYETLGHFTLPPSSWWDNFYEPLERQVASFRDRHKDDACAPRAC